MFGITNEKIQRNLTKFLGDASDFSLVNGLPDILYFKIFDQEFSLKYPPLYPDNPEDDMLFLEFDNILPGYEWLNDINSYIMDTSPSFRRLLYHIKKTYENNKKKSNVSMMMDLSDRELVNFDIQEYNLELSLMNNLNKTSNLSKYSGTHKIPVLFNGKQPGFIIIKELLSLRKKYNKESRIQVNPIENNPYVWQVKFGNFRNTNLQRDINELSNLYNYNYIELQIDFHDKLYPSYPPKVSIIRPRLDNDLMYKLPNINILRLEYWTPSRSMDDVILKLYNVINENAKISTNHPLNDICKSPYYPLEFEMMMLSSLCDIENTLDKDKYIRIMGDVEKQETSSKTYWNKGTGYGHGGQKAWNIDEHKQLQMEKDNQFSTALQIIYEKIITYQDREELFNILKDSYLMDFIKSQFQGTTILEMNKHLTLFNTLISILEDIICPDSVTLFTNIVNDIAKLANEVENILQISHTTIDALKEDEEYHLAIKVYNIFNILRPIYQEYLSSKMDVDTIENNYVSKMAKHKISFGSFKDRFIIKHESGTFSKMAMSHLSKEISSMDLPITFSSVVLLCIEKTTSRMLRTLITGPNSTPYDCGVFIFDTFITSNYPSGPPKTLLVNTGNIRFNPNLYNCGKVCLSLLGTWSGNGGETWNQYTSTISQIFISIQSLILTEEPCFNEPGHEASRGKKEGDDKNKKYNYYIRYYTMLHAVYNVITNLNNFPEFRNAIIDHFKYKKEYILKTFKQWVDEFEWEGKSIQHEEKLTKKDHIDLYDKIKIELDKL